MCTPIWARRSAGLRRTTSRCSTSSGPRWPGTRTPSRWRGPRASPPRELAPFARGIAEILPPIFEEIAEEAANGVFPGDGNPITSAASSMAHIVHASEAHGIDASVMRAVEGLTRRAIGLGHGADGFGRVADLLSRR